MQNSPGSHGSGRKAIVVRWEQPEEPLAIDVAPRAESASTLASAVARPWRQGAVAQPLAFFLPLGQTPSEQSRTSRPPFPDLSKRDGVRIQVKVTIG